MFSILRLTVIAGNLDEAVRRPDGLVLTQSLARKYFGDRPALNQTLELDRLHVLRVTAVVRIYPSIPTSRPVCSPPAWLRFPG